MERLFLAAMVALMAAIAFMVLALAGMARARDIGQWGNNDAAISEWYRSLMQPLSLIHI